MPLAGDPAMNIDPTMRPARILGCASLAIAGLISAILASAGCQPQADQERPPQPHAEQERPLQPQADPAPPPQADAAASELALALQQAREHQQPIMVVVAESGRSPADAEVLARFRDAGFRSHLGTTALVVLDQAGSRVRAEAMRFHLADAPLLIMLSSRGLGESRDEAPFDDALIAKRLSFAEHIGAALDERFTDLEERVTALPEDDRARIKLARFLISRGNATEAIPHLAQVHASAQADPALRVQAAVEEAQAHVWIGEPEKGRQVAEELIATLGAQSPEARCAGYYALGEQDVLGRHRERGLHELDQAIAAAPASDYGIKAKAVRDRIAADGK